MIPLQFSTPIRQPHRSITLKPTHSSFHKPGRPSASGRENNKDLRKIDSCKNITECSTPTFLKSKKSKIVKIAETFIKEEATPPISKVNLSDF